uniref:Uncharacterized protein n=1 Tax=Arundo donax TaxID=35708 RepID=A0A0A9FP46_ARUDO
MKHSITTNVVSWTYFVFVEQMYRPRIILMLMQKNIITYEHFWGNFCSLKLIASGMFSIDCHIVAQLFFGTPSILFISADVCRLIQC